ncbi:MAG: zf-HC2 domain-containing protein [Phycisphaerae bacterium]
MNCEQAREQLVELVYGELDSPGEAAVMAHVGTCQACRLELEQFRRARAALRQYRAGEPAGGMGVSPVRAAGILPADAALERGGETPMPRYFGARRLAFWTAAVAAAVLLAIAIARFLPPVEITSPAVAGPVEIKKMNVALTILSQPPDWPDYGTMQMDQQAKQQTYAPQMDVQLAYGQSLSGYGPIQGWPGLALVRDQRVAFNLAKGTNQVKFTDVPKAILPDTVRLRSLDDPEGMTILEQNYQYDLATAWAILHKYVDRQIAVTYKDQQAVVGNLLSFDENSLVIQPMDVKARSGGVQPAGKSGPQTIARKEINMISFEKLPDGLLSKPTLVWDLKNAAAARQQFEVAYMTYGLKWRADYVLKLRVGGKEKARGERQEAEGKTQEGTGGGDPGSSTRKSAIRNPERTVGPQSAIFDSADLVGYATVANHSGVTYQDATLKLLAGDVNLIKPDRTRWLEKELKELRDEADKKQAEQFQEKSFFEYHLYTLGRPTTIADREVKQIELVSGDGLAMRRTYIYDPNVNGTAARVVSELANTETNHLGKALPKGMVRLYAPDPEGVDTFVANTEIDHTPKGEKLRLPWGFAFDIACSYKQTNYTRSGPAYGLSGRYALRNAKDYGVNVTAVIHYPITVSEMTVTATELTPDGKPAKPAKSIPWHKREVGWAEVELPLAAGAAVQVDFTYRGNDRQGGGLMAPDE